MTHMQLSRNCEQEIKRKISGGNTHIKRSFTSSMSDIFSVINNVLNAKLFRPERVSV